MAKMKLLLGCSLLGWALPNLYAQVPSTMFVQLNNTSQPEYALPDVKSLTFPSGKIAINKTDGQSDLLAVTSVKKVFFRVVITSLQESWAAGTTSHVHLYPNPIKGDAFKIQYELTSASPVLIEIVNANGIVEKQIPTHGAVGNNELVVSTEGLISGLYLCHIKAGDFAETTKIIKY